MGTRWLKLLYIGLTAHIGGSLSCDTKSMEGGMFVSSLRGTKILNVCIFKFAKELVFASCDMLRNKSISHNHWAWEIDSPKYK